MEQNKNTDRCLCKHCHRTFDIKESVLIKRELYNVEIEELRCPFCGGSFNMIDIPYDLDKYLYVNNDIRFYKYGNNNQK